jgi:hypothetical protein
VYNEHVSLRISDCDTPKEHAICFTPGNGMPWVMKICNTDVGVKIEFNREAYPDCLPEDFAGAVAKILAQSGYLDVFYKGRNV